MPEARTITQTTLYVRDFHSPAELAEALRDLLDYAERLHNAQPHVVHLETALSKAILIEKKLLDGSAVYNIELA